MSDSVRDEARDLVDLKLLSEMYDGLPSEELRASYRRALALVQEYRFVQLSPHLATPSWAAFAGSHIRALLLEDAKANRPMSEDEMITVEQLAQLALQKKFKCFVCGMDMRMRWFARQAPGSSSSVTWTSTSPRIGASIAQILSWGEYSWAAMCALTSFGFMNKIHSQNGQYFRL